jgi:hypothetical protein
MRAAILSNSPWKDWNSRDNHAIADNTICPKSTEKNKTQRALPFEDKLKSEQSKERIVTPISSSALLSNRMTREQSKENIVPSEIIKIVPDTDTSLLWQLVALDDVSTKLSPMPNVIACSPTRNNSLASDHTRAVAGESVFKLVQVLKACTLERGDTNAALQLGETEAKVATPKRCQTNGTAEKASIEDVSSPAIPANPQNLTARTCIPEKAPTLIEPLGLSIVCEGSSATEEGTRTAGHRSLASFCQHEETTAALPPLDTLERLLLAREHAANAQQHEAVQSLILQLDITLGFSALNSALGADTPLGTPPPTPLAQCCAAAAGQASPAGPGDAANGPLFPASDAGRRGPSASPAGESSAGGASLLADDSGLLLLHSESAALIGARERGSLEPTSVSDSSFCSADAILYCGPPGGGTRQGSESPPSARGGAAAAVDDTGLSVTAGSLGSWAAALAAALQSPRRSASGVGGGGSAFASLLLDSPRVSTSPPLPVRCARLARHTT